MAREQKKRRKRSQKQRKTTLRAQEASTNQRCALGETTNHTPFSSSRKTIKGLEEEVQYLKKKVQEGNQRWYKERRRNARAEKAVGVQKENIHEAKAEAKRLRGLTSMLGKNLDEVRKDADESIRRLQDRIERLERALKDLNQRRVVLWKRCKRLTAAKSALKKRMAEMRKARPATFQMMRKGRYTPEARRLARLLVSSGAAERKVGEAMQDIGSVLGVEIKKRVSARSIQRFVLEKGVAADLQVIYEIIKSASKSC